MRTLVVLATLSVAMLAACASPSAGTPAAPANPASAPAAAAPAAPAPAAEPASRAAPPVPIKVVQPLPTRDFGFLLTIVANSKGFFAEEGLEVDQPVMAAPAAVAALTNREVQFATANSAMRAAYQGAPLKTVFYSYNRCTFYAVGAPEVRSYRDLVGKTLAVSAPGSSEDLASKLLLQREGIPLSDVNLAVLGQSPQRAQALVGGQVQFTVLNPDLAIDMERRGFNLLGHFRDLMPVPWAGFATHEDILRDQPDMVKAWLRASVRAVQFVRNNPAETVDIAVRELGLDPEVARRGLELALPAIDENDPGGLSEAGLITTARLDLEVLNLPGDPAELGKRVHDVTLLRQAQRELGIRCVGGYQCQ
jgi:ABC-type nitrate/sulfonate/bicarbonate transport system substrate-binding protein